LVSKSPIFNVYPIFLLFELPLISQLQTTKFENNIFKYGRLFLIIVIGNGIEFGKGFGNQTPAVNVKIEFGKG
jgi:hypothetical protein